MEKVLVQTLRADKINGRFAMLEKCFNIPQLFIPSVGSTVVLLNPGVKYALELCFTFDPSTSWLACGAFSCEGVPRGRVAQEQTHRAELLVSPQTPPLQSRVKRGDGEMTLAANRTSVEDRAKNRGRLWVAAMEATLFTGWVDDQLRPFTQDFQVAHPV